MVDLRIDTLTRPRIMPATPPEELYYKRRNMKTQTLAAFMVSGLSNYAFCFVPVAVLGFALMEKTKETSRHCAANCSDSGTTELLLTDFCRFVEILAGHKASAHDFGLLFKGILDLYADLGLCHCSLLIFSCEVSRSEHHSMSKLPGGLFLRCLPHFGPLRLPPPLWSLGHCFYRRTPNITQLLPDRMRLRS